jgi:hypothetical protein
MGAARAERRCVYEQCELVMHDAIARAREILEATSDMPRAERPPDPLSRWKADADRFTAEQAAAKEELRREERAVREAVERRSTDDWLEYFERRLADERAAMVEATGEALATIRKQLRQEIAALRSELTTLKSANVRELKRRG